MSIYEWVSTAIGYIPFGGDRAEVSAELHAHFEDHRDALIASGVDRQNAERRALEAMGDPDETGRLLRKIHRPWLGWAWTASRWILGAALALFIISWFGGGAWHLGRLWQGYPGDTPMVRWSEHMEEPDRIFSKEGNCGESVRTGAYRLSLEKAAAFRTPSPAEEGPSPTEGCREYDSVFMIFKIQGPVWLDFPEELRWSMTAEDSFGTVYANGMGSRGVRTSDPSVAGNPIGRRFGTHYLEMWLSNGNADAEWLDIRLSRGGEDLPLLRIYFDTEVRP